MISSWQKRRSTFNHDWLKNQYMSALAKFLNILNLNGRVRDLPFEQSFISLTFSQWETHRDEARALFQDFEVEMSPRQLFDRPPLSRCDAHTRQWLGDLVHHLWVTRYSVKQLIAEALEHVEHVDAAYSELQEVFQNCTDTSSVQALKSFRAQFAVFRRRCQDLAYAISKFPSEIKVT